MLGNHEGISPLTSSDIEDLKKPILKGMARLKVGKTVQDRQKMIARALMKMTEADPYWLEGLTSKLTEEGVESADAQTLVLTAAADLRDKEVSDFFLQVNSAQRDEFVGRVMKGLISAAPEMEERILKGRIDSDQLMLRTVIAHIFRRDPDNVFQMFAVDATTRGIDRVWKGGTQGMVKWGIERMDDVPAPDGAVGYLVLLGRLNFKAGMYLYPSKPEARAMVQKMRDDLSAFAGMEPGEEMDRAIIASAFSGYYLKGHAGDFTAILEVLSEEMGEPYFVLYAADDDGGVTTNIIPIKANSVEEARRVSRNMQEVRMHDDFRKMQEMVAQAQDAAKVEEIH